MDHLLWIIIVAQRLLVSSAAVFKIVAVLTVRPTEPQYYD
jgi:hypothetical protein